MSRFVQAAKKHCRQLAETNASICIFQRQFPDDKPTLQTGVTLVFYKNLNFSRLFVEIHLFDSIQSQPFLQHFRCRRTETNYNVISYKGNLNQLN